MDYPKKKKIVVEGSFVFSFDAFASVLLLLSSSAVDVLFFSLRKGEEQDTEEMRSALARLGKTIPLFLEGAPHKKQAPNSLPDAILCLRESPSLHFYSTVPHFSLHPIPELQAPSIALDPAFSLSGKRSGLEDPTVLKSKSPRGILLNEKRGLKGDKPVPEYHLLLLLWRLLFPASFQEEKSGNVVLLKGLQDEAMLKGYTSEAFSTEEELTGELGKKGIAGRYEMAYPLERNNPQLSLVETGWEHRRKKSLYGPAIRDFYIFHYVYKGQGVYWVKDQKILLKEGDCFLVPPDTPVRYGTLNEECSYYWVGFQGSESKSLSEKCGYLTEGVFVRSFAKGNPLQHHFYALAHLSLKEGSLYQGLSEFYAILAFLIFSSSPLKETKDSYVEAALQEIALHSDESLSVASLSQKIGLERSYFYRLFKKKTGQSIEEYLLSTRLEKAKKALLESGERIQDIALHSGWSSYLSFLSYFQKKTGLSPREFRSRYQKKND
jgi:AraC family transcriptional regulator of arabinose operon